MYMLIQTFREKYCKVLYIREDDISAILAICSWDAISIPMKYC